MANIPAIGRLLARLPANDAMVRALFRRIGLTEALDAGRISQEVVDCFRSLLNDTDTMRNELRAGPTIVRPLRGINTDLLFPPAFLASVDTPVYFLWGEKDPFGGAEIARAFVPQLPNATLEILAGAGHAVWLDDPSLVAEKVSAFLAA